MAGTRLKSEPASAVSVPRNAAAASETTNSEYRTRPSDLVIEAFLDHVRATGEPETFAGICRTPPPKGSRPVFLRRFDVDRKKRADGREAPCAICSPFSPKFLHNGYFTWYPDEAVIRAIGPECGDAVFGGSDYAEAKSVFDLAERERLAVEFLEKNLGKVLGMIVALQATRPAASEAHDIYLTFRRDAPTVQKKLRAIKAADGVLKVSIVRERGKEDEDEDRIDGPRGFGKRDSDFDSYDVTFGQVPDSALLHASFDPLKELDEIELLLAAMPKFTADYEAFKWICDQSASLEALEEAEQAMREAARRYVRLCGKLVSCAEFLSARLFESLDAWGRHADNPFNLEAYHEAGLFRLKHGRTYREREEARLWADMAKLKARGNWPGFD